MISVSCSSRQRQQNMTSTRSNWTYDGKQDKLWAAEGLRALRGSPGEVWGLRQSGEGGPDQRMTSPPWGSPPSFLHYEPLLSEVNSWSSSGRTSHTNTFIPSLTCGHTFLRSDVVFCTARHLWEFRGSFLGMWWIKHKEDDWDSH